MFKVPFGLLATSNIDPATLRCHPNMAFINLTYRPMDSVAVGLRGTCGMPLAL